MFYNKIYSIIEKYCNIKFRLVMIENSRYVFLLFDDSLTCTKTVLEQMEKIVEAVKFLKK